MALKLARFFFLSMVKLPCDGKFYRKLAKQVKSIHTPILYQCSYCPQEDIKETKHCLNSAQLINVEGKLQGIYLKQQLIPEFEYNLKDAFSYWFDKKQFFSDINTAKKVQTFSFYESINLIPTICYDILFPEVVRAALAKNHNLIINMSNDALFGISSIAWIDLMMARFRVVEYRIPMVRVTNSGYSANIKPSGTIDELSVMPLFVKGTKNYQVPIARSFSFYAYAGNWFLYLITAYLFLNMLYPYFQHLKTFNSNFI